ncbi:hypothetical protein QQS21_009565 [Conoideocrella luteorostrata]|uniref:Uncharacterized protein n=1 Tax=Conoideocrella luteorostrata TaxID=1105319 RepID=A0AAJ0FQ90_9HYPO|nr:hypothetical protein QQS21_009565 [Conoideocrella luteorostrata]
MPTPTQYFGYSVTNIGPLTTRFTPAPSCATTQPNVYIETQLADTRGLYGYPSCAAPKYEGCLPSGKSFDDLNSQLAASPHNGNLVFHSPGLRCPSGWKRAGAVVGGEKQATRLRGVFTGYSTSTAVPNGNPEPLPKLKAYAGILDPGETLVWCCPKGFRANDDAMCTSDLGPLSSVKYSQRCEVYLPTQDILTVTSYQGTRLNNPLIIITPAVTGISSSTYTIAPSETSGLTVVSAVPVVALIHKPSDTKGKDNWGNPVADDDSPSTTLKPNLLGAILGTVLVVWTVANSF